MLAARHPHEDHVADRGFDSWDLYNLVPTPVPLGKAMDIPAVKVAVDKRFASNHVMVLSELVEVGPSISAETLKFMCLDLSAHDG